MYTEPFIEQRNNFWPHTIPDTNNMQHQGDSSSPKPLHYHCLSNNITVNNSITITAIKYHLDDLNKPVTSMCWQLGGTLTCCRMSTLLNCTRMSSLCTQQNLRRTRLYTEYRTDSLRHIQITTHVIRSE